MKLEAKAQLRIARTPDEVFEAIVDPSKMSHYFISRSSGRMETGATLTWGFGDVGAESTVKVLATVPSERISFKWPAEGPATRVDIVLEEDSPGATAVKVTDGPYAGDEQGIAKYGSQIFGWAHFLLCLKAYLEFGINLRDGSITTAHKRQIAQAQAARA